MNVYLNEPMEPEALAELMTFANVFTPDKYDLNEEYDVVYTKLRPVKLSEKQCDYVACPCTNTAHIEVGEGVKVISLDETWRATEGRNVTATAELAWAMYMSLMRKIIPAHEHVMDGGWDREPFRGNEIANKAALVIGFGRIGKKIRHYAQAFGMATRGYDPPIGATVTLASLIPHADVIFICCTSNASTKNLIGAKEFKLMKPNAILINTARSEIVEPKALHNALKAKVIAGAALDVMESYDFYEWLNLASYADSNDNLIITPHIGGNTHESRLATDMYIVKKLKELL